MNLPSRYQQIQNTLEASRDFSIESLTISRNLFEITKEQIIPRKFEVLTTLAGLPVPTALTVKFIEIVSQIQEILPANTRYYWVKPPNYHWELFILKRPKEEISSLHLQQAPSLLKETLTHQQSFSLVYRGFLITPDGTVIVRGYGEFDSIRTQLKHSIPWASSTQSQLGHISLGRILDPIGETHFKALQQLAQASFTHLYGEFQVKEIKLVHEQQWYMEQYKVIATFPLNTNSVQ